MPILKQIYHERWTIEEFFKYIKRNFDFGSSELKSAEAIRKSIYCQLIIAKLVNLFAKIGRRKLVLKNAKTHNKSEIKSNRIINKSTLTSGFYSNMLILMLNGILNRSRLDHFFNTYVVLITTNKGKCVRRICVTPHLKWYSKQYTKKATRQNDAD